MTALKTGFVLAALVTRNAPHLSLRSCNAELHYTSRYQAYTGYQTKTGMRARAHTLVTRAPYVRTRSCTPNACVHTRMIA